VASFAETAEAWATVNSATKAAAEMIVRIAFYLPESSSLQRQTDIADVAEFIDSPKNPPII